MNPPDSSEPKRTVRDLEMQDWIENREVTPDDIWRRWMLVVGVVVVLAVVGAGFGYRPLKRARARKLAAIAESQLAAGQNEAARISLKKAMGLGITEPEVLRALAHYSTKAGLPDAVDYWAKLITMAQATDKDRLEMAQAAMTVGRVDLVDSLCRKLLASQPRDIEALRLLVRARLIVENFAGATEGLRTLIALEPGNERDQVTLARLLLMDTNSSVRANAKTILMGLAVSRSPVANDAIVALAPEKDLTDAEIRVLLIKLKYATNGGFLHRAVGADLELRLDTNQTSAVVARMMEGFDKTSAEELLPLAMWIERHDPKRFAEFLTPERMKANRSLPALKAEALADSKQWEALTDLLNSSTNWIGDTEIAWLQARMAADRHKIEEARASIKVGIQSTGSSQRILFNLATLAELLGLNAEAIEAWEVLGASPNMVLRSTREIIRLAALTSDLAAVRRAIERLDSFMPEQPNILGERAILDEIFNERVVQAGAVLAQLLSKDPTNGVWRDGMALAKLRMGDPAAALGLLEEKGFDWATADPRGKAIYVSVLGSAGQREAARRYARMVPMEKLRAVERQLVEPWQ